jgi:dTDP-4-amino-4,6-dideoxygalactose transaminase
MERLSEAGVQTTIGTYAVTAQPIFVERGWSPDDTPHARDAMERLLTLPLHTAMADTDVDRVVIALSEALRGL